MNVRACCLLTGLEGLVRPLTVSESHFLHVLNIARLEKYHLHNLQHYVCLRSPDRLGKPEFQAKPTQPNSNLRVINDHDLIVRQK